VVYAFVDLENGRHGCRLWPRAGGCQWLVGDGLSNMTVASTCQGAWIKTTYVRRRGVGHA